MALRVEERETPLRFRAAPINADPPCPGLAPGLQGYNHFYIMCGRPGSGKSALIYNLLHNKKAYRNKFDRIYLFNPSATLDLGIPPDDTFESLDLDALNDILHDEDNIGCEVLIIMDDCVAELTRSSKELLKMIYNRRHVFAEQPPGEEEEGGETSPEDYYRNVILGPKPEDLVREAAAAAAPAVESIEPESDEEEEWAPRGSLSVWITTQKFTKVPLDFRTAASGCFCWQPDTRESRRIYDDLACSLVPTHEHWKSLCSHIYKRPHDFLFVDKLNGKAFRNMRELKISVPGEGAA